MKMPSSPEVMTAVRPWVLDDLSASMPVPVAPELPVFRSTMAVPDEPPLFEVAPSHGVPAEQLEAAINEAHAAGYAVGWSTGLQEAREASEVQLLAAQAEAIQLAADRRTRTTRAVGALDRAAARVEKSAQIEAGELETLVVDTAFAIAEALVGAALRDSSLRGAAAVRRALSLAPAGESVEVRVNPSDHVVLTESGTEELPAGRGREVVIVPDPSLAPGDAVARWGVTTVDARLSAGLARVREVLGS
jgi:flagellar assembly protein FliH